MNAPETTLMPGAVEGGAQHIAGGVEGTSHLTIGIAVLDDEATQVERILGSGASLLHGDAFVLAQFIEEFAIFLVHGFVVGVDEGGFAYVLETQFLGFFLHNLILHIARPHELAQLLLVDILSNLLEHVLVLLDGVLIILYGQFRVHHFSYLLASLIA